MQQPQPRPQLQQNFVIFLIKEFCFVSYYVLFAVICVVGHLLILSKNFDVKEERIFQVLQKLDNNQSVQVKVVPALDDKT